MAADTDSVQTSKSWSRLGQDIGVIIWSGFLAACLQTLLFFALFDPALLMQDDAPPTWLADRRSGYALGFFFFWSITTLAAAIATWLIGTRATTTPGRSQGS